MILGLDNEIAFLLTVSRYGLLRQVKMSVSLTQKHRLCAKTFSGDLVNFSLALSWGTPKSSGFTQILQYVYLWRVHFGVPHLLCANQ